MKNIVKGLGVLIGGVTAAALAYTFFGPKPILTKVHDDDYDPDDYDPDYDDYDPDDYDPDYDGYDVEQEEAQAKAEDAEVDRDETYEKAKEDWEDEYDNNHLNEGNRDYTDEEVRKAKEILRKKYSDDVKLGINQVKKFGDNLSDKVIQGSKEAAKECEKLGKNFKNYINKKSNEVTKNDTTEDKNKFDNADEVAKHFETAEEPTAEEPTAEEPTAEEPTADEPTVEEPTSEIAGDDKAIEETKTDNINESISDEEELKSHESDIN